MTSQTVPVFDGHNDVLLRLMRRPGGEPERAFLDGDAMGHLDQPRMRAGGLAGGLFAIFVPSGESSGADELMAQATYDVPLPPQVPLSSAQAVTLRMAALLLRIERLSGGTVRICRSAADLRDCIANHVLAALLHIEGAEAIDPDFHMLDVLHAAGLRSLGPVWSRSNIFGHGVPFRFPSSPDIGPGLTEAGRALVRACNRRRIMIDLSHLNEAGFWDVAGLTDAPLVATHSNAHAVCPHSRNLTDRQLAAIRESRGMVGLNFATAFIRPDGQRNADTHLEDMIRHLDHLIEHVGVEGVGFGSDFDGATVPAVIGDARGLPRLLEAMRRHGYDEATIRKIAFENWIDVLRRTWGE
ncbi:dipeptidase [Microvirga massiliensis]|uniref:dipeptidase n=1 Tax=Microvirga massiliensis TaxID=1033741 RepID=UPI00062B48F4|nr:dipeptidase [Microvirga massiliensis]